MFKFILGCLAVVVSLAVTGCSDPKPQSELQAKCESLMEKYPNYESNEMAKTALTDSVNVFCESFVGKEATLLKGIEFEFVKSIHNEQKDTYASLFKGHAFCEIEAKGGKTKYIISSPLVQVLGTLSDEQTASLDANQKYSISGTVHAWDGENLIGTHSVMTPKDISFGTFIMETITVTPIEEK